MSPGKMRKLFIHRLTFRILPNIPAKGPKQAPKLLLLQVYLPLTHGQVLGNKPPKKGNPNPHLSLMPPNPSSPLNSDPAEITKKPKDLPLLINYQPTNPKLPGHYPMPWIIPFSKWERLNQSAAAPIMVAPNVPASYANCAIPK